MLGVGEVFRFVIERRQGTNDTDQNRHRMRVTTEALIELHQLLVQHGVVLDGRFEGYFLIGIWQLAVLQQISYIEKVAVRRQLLDRIAAIKQLALVTINIGDLGPTSRGG